jgi:hypothetical protein
MFGLTLTPLTQIMANRAAGAAKLPEPAVVGGMPARTMPAHTEWGTDFAACANKVERPFRED